jgi:hypothetical protein
MYYSEDYDKDDQFNGQKFKRHHGKLMKQALEHLEVRRLAGDNQQAVTGFSVIRVLAEMSGAKRLASKATHALAELAITSRLDTAEKNDDFSSS